MGGYSTPRIPVLPVGDPMLARNLQAEQLNQPIKSVDLESLLQATSSLQSCQYERSEKVTFGLDLNPVINFDPVNPLHKNGNQLKYSVAQTVLQENNALGTFGEMNVQNTTNTNNISEMSRASLGFDDATGHVDVVGDTMFLRIDNNTGQPDNLLDKTNNDKTDSLSVQSQQCSKCFLSFSTVSDLALHLKIEHYGVHKRNRTTRHETSRIAKTIPNLFRCDICGCDFFFDSDLLDHQRTVHIPFLQERLELSVNKSPDSLNQQKMTSDGVRETDKTEMAMENLNSVTGKKKETLSILNQKSKMDKTKKTSLVGISTIQSNCKTHQNSSNDEISIENTHEENRWLCSLCTESPIDENAFIIHMKEEHGDTTEVSNKVTGADNQECLWKCNICGGEYFFESDLNDHQDKVHSQVVLDDHNENLKNELIVKLTLKKRNGKQKDETRTKRGRGRVCIPAANDHNRNKSKNVEKNSDSSERQSSRFRAGRAKGNGKCKENKSTKQNELETYESNDSDIEIIEEPVLVIEIDDKEDIPNKTEPLRNRNENPLGENESASSNKCIFFYCGLCAFKCLSNDILNIHMEGHSLNGEISHESVEQIDKSAEELLGDKYLTVDVERLCLDANLQDSVARHKQKHVRHTGQAISETKPVKEKDDTVYIDKLLQNAGLETSNLCMVSKRRFRVSEQDKVLLKKYKIQEASVVLKHEECIASNVIPDHDSSLPSINWLKGFNDHSDESDIDWDLPQTNVEELEDGYEADKHDNSDIMVTNMMEKPLQTTVKSCSRHSQNYPSVKKVSVIEVDKNANIGKRELRSDKICQQSNVQTFKRGNRSLSSERNVPLNNQKMQTSVQSEPKRKSKQAMNNCGIQQTKACFTQENDKLMKKYGIKNLEICLTDLVKPERNSKMQLKRENSQMFNISETLWWDAKKVKDKIDFRKTPIVPLKRLDDNVAIMKDSKDEKATAKSNIEDTNGKTNLTRSVRNVSSCSNAVGRTQNRSKVSSEHIRGKTTSLGRKDVDFRTPVKKSSRLLEQACVTKRKAHQKALSLIENKDTHLKRIKLKQSSPSTKTIQMSSHGPHKNKMLHGQRKRLLEESDKASVTANTSNDCVVKLARLSLGDIENWKEKGNDSENKIKEQMLKILTPEKIKSRVIVDKLPSEAFSNLKSITKDTGKKTSTHRCRLDVENSKTGNQDVELNTSEHAAVAIIQTENHDVELTQSQRCDITLLGNGDDLELGFIEDIKLT